jgi:hypothetical protein
MTISATTAIVGADVIPADVIAPDNEDIRLLLLRRGRICYQGKRQQHGTGREADMPGHNISLLVTDTLKLLGHHFSWLLLGGHDRLSRIAIDTRASFCAPQRRLLPGAIERFGLRPVEAHGQPE